eukprot:scaffold12005_cov212-Amphora_coffeaeformis.AAC.9
MIFDPSSPTESVRTLIQVDDPASSSLARPLDIYQQRSVICTQVSFQEVRNEYYNNVQMNRAEIKELWYTRRDLCRFRQHTLEMARRLILADRQTSDMGQDNCVQQLARLYQDFCNDKDGTKHTATTAVAATTATFDFVSYATHHHVTANAFSRGSLLAMEKWVVRSAGKDRLERRRRLYRVACRNDDDDGSTRCPMTLSQKCQAISKPVRLWAHHMALVVAAHGAEWID